MSQPKLFIIVNQEIHVCGEVPSNAEDPADVIEYTEEPMLRMKMWKVRDSLNGEWALDGDPQFNQILKRIIIRHGVRLVARGTGGNIKLQA